MKFNIGICIGGRLMKVGYVWEYPSREEAEHNINMLNSFYKNRLHEDIQFVIL